jgi:tRNA-binding protein
MLPAPIKPVISLQDLNQIDIRVGTIERVAEVPNSEKLMELTVDFGDHHRRILAGIRKERRHPKELEGRQTLFVVNLPPRKMAGLVSEGMLFDLGYADGLESPALAIPEYPIPNGTRAE